MGPASFARSAAIALICLGTPASAESISVGNWQIARYPLKSATPSGCLMMTSYNSGTVLGLQVGRDYQWSIGLLNDKWRLSPKASTPVTVFIDGKLLTSGQAFHTSTTGALLPLTATGADGFQSLRLGHRMEIVTPNGKLAFSLDGTAQAMATTLNCVDLLNGRTPSIPTPATAESSRNFEVLGDAEATALLTNILNGAGVRGYRLEAPHQKNQPPRYVLADGTRGFLVASRGDTKNADEYASWQIGELSRGCKGDFASGKQTVPSTDGSVIRKVMTTCRTGSNVETIESTIIRKPNGFMVALVQTMPQGSAALQPRDNGADANALVDAVLKLPSSR